MAGSPVRLRNRWPIRLAHMAAELTALLARWQPEIAVLETPFLGMNTRSLVVLAQARGALLAVLAAQGLEIDEYTPAEVKNAVTGTVVRTRARSPRWSVCICRWRTPSSARTLQTPSRSRSVLRREGEWTAFCRVGDRPHRLRTPLGCRLTEPCASMPSLFPQLARNRLFAVDN